MLITPTTTMSDVDARTMTSVQARATVQTERTRLKRKRPASASSSSSVSPSSEFATATDAYSSDYSDTDSESDHPQKSKQSDGTCFVTSTAKKKTQRTVNQLELNSNQSTTITTSSRNALPRGWSQLNIDFIESITPFLRKREISYLHRTCHVWLHIADHIRTPHLIFPNEGLVRMSKVISDLIHSLIRRHVSELRMSQEVSPPELELITLYLPKLHRLTCSIGYFQHSSWIFPRQLKELSVTFDLEAAAASLWQDGVMSLETLSNWLNESILGMCDLTSIAKLEFRNISMTSVELTQDRLLSLAGLPINVQPLIRLVPSLTDLRLDIPVTTDRIVVLRQLVNLISLALNSEMSHQQLSDLLAEPLPFKLEKCCLVREFSNEDAPLLKRLTHLTEFVECENTILTDLSFLSDMVQLREIFLDVLHLESLAESLHANRCQSLTSLGLSESDINDHDLSHIFSPDHPMPALKKISLSDLFNIMSLTFIRQVSATLESFSLCHCTLIEPRELIHLRFFPHLHHLELIDSFPSERQPDSLTLGLINPASNIFQRDWFPALTTFNYDPNIDDD